MLCGLPPLWSDPAQGPRAEQDGGRLRCGSPQPSRVPGSQQHTQSPRSPPPQSNCSLYHQGTQSPEAGCPGSPRQPSIPPVKPRAVRSPWGLPVLGNLPRQQHTSPHFHVVEASSDLADARWPFHLVPGEGEKREGGQGWGPGRTGPHNESRSTEDEDQDAAVPCRRGRSELGRG